MYVCMYLYPIHNWSLLHFSKDYRLSFSHQLTLRVLILYINGGTYSLKPTPNYRFFEKRIMAILYHTQSFCQKPAERKLSKKYFLYCVLMPGVDYSHYQQVWGKNGTDKHKNHCCKTEIFKWSWTMTEKVLFCIKWYFKKNTHIHI